MHYDLQMSYFSLSLLFVLNKYLKDFGVNFRCITRALLTLPTAKLKSKHVFLNLISHVSCFFSLPTTIILNYYLNAALAGALDNEVTA